MCNERRAGWKTRKLDGKVVNEPPRRNVIAPRLRTFLWPVFIINDELARSLASYERVSRKIVIFRNFLSDSHRLLERRVRTTRWQTVPLHPGVVRNEERTERSPCEKARFYEKNPINLSIPFDLSFPFRDLVSRLIRAEKSLVGLILARWVIFWYHFVDEEIPSAFEERILSNDIILIKCRNSYFK